MQQGRFQGIDHFQLAIPLGAEEEARAFFVGRLGFTEVPKPAVMAARGGAWFEAGETRVHVGAESAFVPAKKAHPALLVNDLKNLVSQAQLEATWSDEIPGSLRCHIYDPFGNRIELIEADEKNVLKGLNQDVEGNLSTPTGLKIALCQRKSVLGDVTKNLDEMEATIKDLRGKADLAVFPELTTTGYDDALRGKVDSLSESSEGLSFRRLSCAAREAGVGVLYGYIEGDEDGKKYISAQWIGADGKRLANIRKTHLWTYSRFEAEEFVPGEELSKIVEFCGIPIAVVICFDLEVPETARALSRKGAKVILTLGACASSYTLDSVVSVRAFENLVHVIYVNHAGAPFAGRSIACAPNGSILARIPNAESPVSPPIVHIDPNRPEYLAHAERNPFTTALRSSDFYSATN